MSDLNFIFSFLTILWRELLAHKYKLMTAVIVLCVLILPVGAKWPVKFETGITIYADNQNIIKPLLQGQAAVTRVKENKAKVVQNVMHSPRILSGVIDNVYGVDAFESAAEREMLFSDIRERLKLKRISTNYIQINFQDSDPDRAYGIINEAVNVFLKDSSDSKKEESKSAYHFIDSQVKAYKAQLIGAEEQLKIFDSKNFDGSGGSVDSRIAQLRATIEELEIDNKELSTRIKYLDSQVSEEAKYSIKEYKSQVFHEQLSELSSQLSLLKMHYKDDYPDIVKVKLQIEDVKQEIQDLDSKKLEDFDEGGSAISNPLYEELRSKHADAKIQRESNLRRLASYNKSLEEQYERRQQVANNQAEFAELTRDYSVTKKIYEDMLARKEMARLSMTLDIEGQGVSYRIQEPAVFPLTPSGLRFIHFIIFGPIFSVLIVIGFMAVFLFLDPRIRSKEELSQFGDIEVLAVVSHMSGGESLSIARSEVVRVLAVGSLCIAVYIGFAYVLKLGLI